MQMIWQLGCHHMCKIGTWVAFFMKLRVMDVFTWYDLNYQLILSLKNRGEGGFKNAYDLGFFKSSLLYKLRIFEWVRYFVWNFKGYLWNSTQNILPIHWKIQFLYIYWKFKSSRMHFWNAPPGPWYQCSDALCYYRATSLGTSPADHP